LLAQQGPGHFRDGFGQQRVDLGVTEKLVGFRFYTDHSTPRISFIIADMGTPQQIAPAPQPMTRESWFEASYEYDEVWKCQGVDGVGRRGKHKEFSVWKARVPPGCFSLGMTAQYGHSMPSFPTLVIRAGADQIAPPERYELAWHAKHKHAPFWCWHPIPPPGYASFGDVVTLSAEPPSLAAVACVAIESLPGARQPLGAQIWDDASGLSPKDAAFWAHPGGTGLFRCNDDGTQNRPKGDFYLPAPAFRHLRRARESCSEWSHEYANTQPAVAPAPWPAPQPVAAPAPLQAKPEPNPKSNPNPNPSPGPNPSPSTPPSPSP